MAKPFIKWVGGKQQLIPSLLPFFPEKIGTYFEPFIGGGAVYWYMQATGRFEQACINDHNQELVATYGVVRDQPEVLMVTLRDLEALYCGSPAEVYEQQRSLDPKTLTPLTTACRFIFLNKAGFNGLYRVNRYGKFNSPWGHKAVIKLYDRINILECSQALNGRATITSGDFEAAVAQAKAGDFVYFDPPYVPVSATSDFASYTADGFGMPEQTRLRDLMRGLRNRGVVTVMSNSAAPVLRDMYQDFDIHEISAKRAINSKGDGRGPVKEIVVGRPV